LPHSALKPNQSELGRRAGAQRFDVDRERREAARHESDGKLAAMTRQYNLSIEQQNERRDDALRERLEALRAQVEARRADDAARAVVREQRLPPSPICMRHASRLTPACARAPPLAFQPSSAVSHPADARRRALGGAQHSMVPILSERSFLGLGKGYITKEALDTPWCHYQTLAPPQEGEKPAPEAKNDREKGQNGHATPPGNTGTAATSRT
jgi:hypothetical protein